jgi:hypothetical protein
MPDIVVTSIDSTTSVIVVRETTPSQNINLDFLSDVDTSGGATGDVLTQQEDGTFAMETPTGGSDIDETLATDLSYSGPISTITVGETVSFGDHLYRSPADGLYYQAQANAVLTVPVTRMALEAVTIGEECLTLCSGGIIRNDAWDFTNDGSIIEIWLSAAVAGGMTESVDTSVGCFGQVVGTPLASNILEFRPSLPVARF